MAGRDRLSNSLRRQAASRRGPVVEGTCCYWGSHCYCQSTPLRPAGEDRSPSFPLPTPLMFKNNFEINVMNYMKFKEIVYTFIIKCVIIISIFRCLS